MHDHIGARAEPELLERNKVAMGLNLCMVHVRFCHVLAPSQNVSSSGGKEEPGRTAPDVAAVPPLTCYT